MDIFQNLDKNSFINFSGEFLYVSGVVEHLQPVLVKKLYKSLNFNFVFSKSNNSDIRKYLRTIQNFDLDNSSYTLAALEYSLESNGFENVNKVSTFGEWSIKGDLVYLWPIEYEHPIRISFFGDDIEFIELYDEVYGTKIERISTVVYGNLNILPENSDRDRIELSGQNNLNPNYKIIFTEFDHLSESDDKYSNVINFDYSFPNLYYKRFDILSDELKRLTTLGWNIKIYSKHSLNKLIGLEPYLIKDDKSSDFLTLKELSAGFSSPKNKSLFLTDRELFGTIFLEKERKKITTKQAQKILEQLEGEIEINNYIVHEDHGIGVYKGLKQEKFYQYKIVEFREVKFETTQDFLSIEYLAGDELLVPISQIQKITKYIGTDNEEPNITRLHKGNWSASINKARKSVELIAKDLVKHYAKVQIAKVNSIEYEDSDFYLDFIKTFQYEETEDQIKAIEDIKKDLTRTVPMDRLIVGDVGFGKTEVAMRAAFKIIEDGKQVVVLCPTTVLAAQHYQVFKNRFSVLGAKVNYVSRFNSTAENKKIIERANSGEVDILVGTHRLLSNDVKLKKLGLIIIDEEQKFGVKQKEKIKQLQYEAHSLTLTATPIPRTLSMALSQIKEISIIATPPSGRKSVETHVEKLDWQKIKLQIMTEVKRGGQAYFLHNKVETIESIKSKLERLMPSVRFAVGHGQMKGNQLDKLITDFYDEKYDVLICTTIIENGIDMPNVNTIIINDGQNFGLGQLYQLRGRVGRSDKQAYCYIYYKGDDINKDKIYDTVEEDEDNISKKNKKSKKYIERLKAILESQELGSGFKLASRDLEIRGAGNLLGKQQHGNIANIGLALYMQMLAEEIEKLKTE